MSRLREDDADRRRAAALGPDYSEALARGLLVLATFNETRRSQSLSDIARAVDLPRATVRRALLTLTALGYVAQEERRFRLTPRVLRLAAAYLTSNVISTLLQPACDRIARRLGESCTAAVLEGDEVVMIARALPDQLVPAGVGIGYRLPAYCSALGRVLLAALPDPALDAYLDRVALVAQTQHTLTDRAAVRRAIIDARAAGSCFVDQEAEYGFRSIAVPLRKFDGTVVAALNVGARLEQASVATMTGPYLRELLDEAATLSGFLI
ncbi:IclR family transcriptional regulator domain-containing protein [Acidisphaera rubrifaciens]|uniref:IclR family transcriptional regulator domain-containing protein n=1 Tax=Acidisphaera rubrifaciens TaxID=50715 RepID=UPI0009FF7439|nr:IclR family transcriptional regulator C-terminal domain-containing protein [Acidisphaera rubrifaciens]